MDVLKVILTWSMIGFLIKMLSGVFAIIFGIAGLGQDIRDADHKLTPKGRIVRRGIVIAGSLAIATTLYDYLSARKTAQEEKEKSDQLMLAVERGLYPIRGATVTLEIDLGSHVPELNDYEQQLRRELPSNVRQCPKSNDFDCDRQDDGALQYRISDRSRLFPVASSDARQYLNSIGAHIKLVRLSPDAKNPYQPMGDFLFDIGELNGARSEIEFIPKTGNLQFSLRRGKIPDQTTIQTGVYSLGELFPGFISAVPTAVNVPTSIQRRYRSDATKLMRLKYFRFDFEYPKAIDSSNNSFRCGLSTGEVALIAMLPDSIEEVNVAGAYKNAPDISSHKESLCARMNDPRRDF